MARRRVYDLVGEAVGGEVRCAVCDRLLESGYPFVVVPREVSDPPFRAAGRNSDQPVCVYCDVTPRLPIDE